MKMSSGLIPPCILTVGDKRPVGLFSIPQGLTLLPGRKSTCFSAEVVVGRPRRLGAPAFSSTRRRFEAIANPRHYCIFGWWAVQVSNL